MDYYLGAPAPGLLLILGGLLESILSLWNGSKASPGAMGRQEYWIRLIVSLPISIAIFILESGFVGFLRAILVLMWLGYLFSWKRLSLYAGFFLCGAMFFSLLLQIPPAPLQLRWILFAVISISFLVFFLMQGRAHLYRKELRILAHRRRLRVLERIEKAREELFDIGLPDLESRAAFSRGSFSKENGLVVVLKINGLALQAGRSREEDFSQRDWDQMQMAIRTMLQDRHLKVSAPGNPVVAFLPESGPVRLQLFQVYFAVMALLHRMEAKARKESRRIELEAFVFSAVIKPYFLLSGWPAFTVPAALEMVPATSLAPFRLWISSDLFGSVAGFFSTTDQLMRPDWIAPRYLRSDLSRDGAGQEPVSDFYQRILYGN